MWKIYTWKRKVENTIWRMGMHLRARDGIGVVEMILILVVLIALVLVFKEKLTSIVNKQFSNITKSLKNL